MSEHLESCPTCGALPCDQASGSAADDMRWLDTQRRLTLSFYSPMYGDDDDQSEEWRVEKESGSINDREWDVIGRGQTFAEAVAAARLTTLRSQHEGAE